MLLNRALRRIADMLTRLESVAVKCTRSFTDACVEGFAANGFALCGYCDELFCSREDTSESEEKESLQGEGHAAHGGDQSGAPPQRRCSLGQEFGRCRPRLRGIDELALCRMAQTIWEGSDGDRF